MRARGTAQNPANRFETLRYTRTPPELDGAGPADREGRGGWHGEEPEPETDPRTELLVDASRSIVATNASPDVGFEASVNPYRGCEHGCVYCYARPTHETLGFSAGLDFETKILVKRSAPELLARRLCAPSWRPQVVALSGVTDPYQPAERRLELTRRCLQVLVDFRNPVVVVTKSWLVTRDLDLLAELAALRAVSVLVSVTSLDATLQHRLEPRASRPAKRLAAIERLAAAGVPVGVMVAPVIPGLTDAELPAILQHAADAGAGFAGKVLLRLPHGVKEIFADWLGRHFPERRQKVLSRLRALHEGRLYDPRFGRRQRGTGVFAEQIDALFDLGCRRAELSKRGPELSTAAFRRPGGTQLALFGQAAGGLS